jgi:endonuclease YncB( thermonuclease family)
MNYSKLLYIAVVLLLMLTLGSCNLPDEKATENLCRVNSIHDGDTMRVTCSGKQMKVRLYCIDTPEIDQKPWGRESRDHLRAMAPKSVELLQRDKDDYGRIVAEVFDGEINLNLKMVRDGRAAVFKRYCKHQKFYDAQDKARKEKLGIWSKSGLHQTPWKWRWNNQ